MIFFFLPFFPRICCYGEVTVHERSVGFGLGRLEDEAWTLCDRRRWRHCSVRGTMKKKLDTRFPAVSIQTLACFDFLKMWK